MADKMYWAAKCKKCGGMVGYPDVRYMANAQGVTVEEELPNGTVERRCDHCGTVGVFDLRQLRPPSVNFLIPRLQ